MYVIECRNLWGMKLNASKTKTMKVCWSRTMHPQAPILIIDGTWLQESNDLDILVATFDSKVTLTSIFARFPYLLLSDLVS